MEPDIFQVSDTICHMIYKDFLVLNLPLAKMVKCLNRLEKGKKYKYIKINTDGLSFLIPCNCSGYNACHSINLNKDKFKIKFNHKKQKITIRKGTYINELDNILLHEKGFLIDWIIVNVKKYRNLTEQTKTISKLYFFIYWFIIALLPFVFLLKVCIALGAAGKNLLLLAILFWLLISPSLFIVKYLARQRNEVTNYFIKR